MGELINKLYCIVLMIGTTDSVHRDTRRLNVYYQRIKPPINKTIGEIYERENANVFADFSRPVFKMADSPLTATKFNKSTRQHTHKTKTDNAHRQKDTTKAILSLFLCLS